MLPTRCHHLSHSRSPCQPRALQRRLVRRLAPLLLSQRPRCCHPAVHHQSRAPPPHPHLHHRRKHLPLRFSLLTVALPNIQPVHRQTSYQQGELFYFQLFSPVSLMTMYTVSPTANCCVRFIGHHVLVRQIKRQSHQTNNKHSLANRHSPKPTLFWAAVTTRKLKVRQWCQCRGWYRTEMGRLSHRHHRQCHLGGHLETAALCSTLTLPPLR
jgi:hypothetical protein